MPAHWSQPDDRRSPAVSGVKLTIVTAITRRVLTECQQLLVCILFTWQGCSTTRSVKPSLSGRIQFGPKMSKSERSPGSLVCTNDRLVQLQCRVDSFPIEVPVEAELGFPQRAGLSTSRGRRRRLIHLDRLLRLRRIRAEDSPARIEYATVLLSHRRGRQASRGPTTRPVRFLGVGSETCKSRI